MAEILARDVVLGKKTVFRLALQTEVQDEGLAREKGARMQVQGPPFQALSTPSREDVSEGVSDLEIPLKFRLIFDQLIIEGSCLRDLYLTELGKRIQQFNIRYPENAGSKDWAV